VNFYKKKNVNIVCFDKDELLKLFETAKKSEIVNELSKQKISFDDLKKNPAEMERVAGILSQKTANDRDEHEIFGVLYVFIDFYEGSEICFELKSDFNPKEDTINSLDDLNRHRADPPDFIVKSTDGLREFELKRYRNALDTDTILKFITEKVQHYGNDLGDMNLLLLLQSDAYDVSKIEFHDLHEKIQNLKFSFEGQILISYNENNKDLVINQVYPDLTTSKIPVVLPSERQA